MNIEAGSKIMLHRLLVVNKATLLNQGSVSYKLWKNSASGKKNCHWTITLLVLCQRGTPMCSRSMVRTCDPASWDEDSQFNDPFDRKPQDACCTGVQQHCSERHISSDCCPCIGLLWWVTGPVCLSMEQVEQLSTTFPRVLFPFLCTW